MLAEPAQHAEEGRGHDPLPAEERAQHHRHVGGHGRERRSRARRARPGPRRRPRPGSSATHCRNDSTTEHGLAHEVDDRRVGTAHRARHPDLAGAAGRVEAGAPAAVQRRAPPTPRARWPPASAPAPRSRGRRRSRSTPRPAGPRPPPHARARRRGGRAARPASPACRSGCSTARPGRRNRPSSRGRTSRAQKVEKSRIRTVRPVCRRWAVASSLQRARAGRGVGDDRDGVPRRRPSTAPPPSATRSAPPPPGTPCSRTASRSRGPRSRPDRRPRSRPACSTSTMACGVARPGLARQRAHHAHEAAREVDDALAGAPAIALATRGAASDRAAVPARPAAACPRAGAAASVGASAWRSALPRSTSQASAGEAPHAARRGQPQARPLHHPAVVIGDPLRPAPRARADGAPPASP